MDSTKESQLDQIYETFDRAWEPTYAGPEGIQAFLAKSVAPGFADSDLVVELIQMDIDRTWLNWDKELEQLVTEADAGKVLQRFQALPRLKDYRQAFPDTFADTSALKAVAQQEFDARNTCGDAIGLQHYRADFAVELERSSRSSQPKVRIAPDSSTFGQGQYEHDIGGCVVFGRQRSSDSSDSLMEPLSSGCRVVIANRRDARISREQLKVQIANPRFAIVTNISQVNPVARIPNQALLQPGEAIVCAFDFSLRLPGRQLHFRN